MTDGDVDVNDNGELIDVSNFATASVDVKV